MSETRQGYLELENGNREIPRNFQTVLDYIREHATSEYGKGALFERLMQQYFTEDPDYKEQFSKVYLWKQWTANRSDFDGIDIGVDLVAERRDDGTFCAIQCKCYAPDTRISKKHIDGFIAASASDIFTQRILIHTGGEIGPNVLRAIEPLGDAFKIIYFRDLENSPFIWPDLRLQDPQQLQYRQQKFHLKPHQQEAFDAVTYGFKEHDRGKMIMACGTGKTFTALKIAEEIAGTGGRVLYLVPSISLLSQGMREWSEQRGVPHTYVGICSDSGAGKTSEDTSIQELKIPVTTDPEDIYTSLRTTDTEKMTVVFCTYQSLPLIEHTQRSEDVPPFDIILCDEAHRTTGIDQPDDQTSPFVLVHNEDRIRANKRLYMTATPRLYTEGARTRAAQRYNVDVFSMDDPATYGPEFHRLPFSKAVELGELSDYKVVVLAISEGEVSSALQGDTGMGGSEINIDDATKIIGCWRALQNPELKASDDPTSKALKRVIAFTNRISESRRMANHWNDIVNNAFPESERPTDFKCETQHVDGTVSAFNRKVRLDWLRGAEDGVCRILSNARCLSEGIDVPALDAVLFMTSRKSHVDIVQAVGRVMRRAEGKEYGYIVLPVAIPDGVDPADALEDNERFATVWGVLRALRSHDDRFNAEINRIDLNESSPGRVIFGTGDGASPPWQPFLPLDIPPGAILPKIVERCGDTRYWESWAKDVADIFKRLVVRITDLLDNPENATLHEWFAAFHKELTGSLNDSITHSDAVDMMAQHIITQPVFDALFAGYDFSSQNPMAQALDNLRNDFEEFGLENETGDLEGFYESVRMRASGIDNSAGRQKVLLELYQKFFVTALKKETSKLGIVYTPVEVVDFVIQSVEAVLQEEFGSSLSDVGVHVLDPFTGTGTFLVRLLQSGLIRPDDLIRKYSEELHANEIVLLAYYIATVNIEEAFRGQRGGDSEYNPFSGITLTDTFNLNTDPLKSFEKKWILENNERAEKQQEFPIEVIIGNPPWAAGKKKAKYSELRERIRETYVEKSTAKLKNSLYDTYKMAIRWASDRVKEQGIVAFVTNGSWIDGNADSGVRACLAKEFSSIHVLHLRGDARTSGERRRREGGNVFGGGTRTPVVITLLVKNPKATHEGCKIRYHDIGDYLTRKQKLDILSEAVSIKGIDDWKTLIPNKHHDWINQRSEIFAQYYPLGTPEARSGRSDDAIFKLYSMGLATSRDAYIYNFSREICAENAEQMTQTYLEALSEIQDTPNPTNELVKEITQNYSNNIKWDRELENNLKRNRSPQFNDRYIRKSMYRPYVSTNCYADYTFVNCKYQQDLVFPDSSSENQAICVPSIGHKKSFSPLIVDKLPDLGFNEACQCFPRQQYPKPTAPSDTTQTSQDFNNTISHPPRR